MVVIGCIALVAVIIALTPGVRARALGSWGFAHLTTLGEKIRFINDPEKAWASSEGEQLGLACGSEYIPYSGEFVMVASASPVRLTVARRDPHGGQSEEPMEQLDERTFQYVSKRFPIVIVARVIGVSTGENPVVRLTVKAVPK